MKTLSPKLTAILAATAAAGFSGAAIAGAAGSSSSSSTTSTTTSRPAPGEQALTGTTKEKVERAALAKVPGGTIIRTETDSGGVYESHVRKSDGTEVVVEVDEDFEVTAVETFAGGRGGPGGHGGRGMHADLAEVAKDLGVTETKLQSAVEAARPDKGSRDDHRAEVAGAIAKSLGEKAADVQAVLDDVHADGGHRGPRGGDDTELVSALVKKFSVSTAKAQAAVDAAEKAHDADREAKRDAFHAAVAKALGKTAAAVEQAFEANLPARP